MPAGDVPELAGSGVRLAELVGTFTLAMDLGLGQPMEHVLRSWLIAAAVGERLALQADLRADLYYVATLAWVGCVADTPELAAIFGDDIAYRHDGYELEQAGLPMLGFMLRHAGRGGSPLQRARAAATVLTEGPATIQRIVQSHCLVTASMADRLGLRGVRDPVQQLFTRWDGKGVPVGLGGDGIALPMRLYQLADVVEVVQRDEGTGAALRVARKRSGTQFDPIVVDAFETAADEVFEGARASRDWDEVIAAESGLRRQLSEEELDVALEAIADFTDLRSPSRGGHSRGVAELAARAAGHAGLPRAEVALVRRAGLLHDIGLHGVPSSILERPGPLSTTQWERVRLHAYYRERMLARPAVLARVSTVASLTNERADGSGYHRGLRGPAISLAGRVLGAACAFRAMTEPRAHRPALTAAQATTELRREVRGGRFTTDAADAVIAAAGQRVGKRQSGPAGLTPREIEVLRLIARGASTRRVAETLGVSAKTAGTHIERIYGKTGASTRSTAALYAMQHGLLDTLEPLDL